MMAKLAIEDLKAALKRLPDWQLAEGREAITRKFQFVDFDAAFAFMTRGGAAGGEDGSPSRMVQCLQQGRGDAGHS